MLGFFTTLGLNADLKMLKKAGSLLIIFLLSSIGLLVAQNITGIGLTLAMGENPLIGLIGGSVSLTGDLEPARMGTVFEKRLTALHRQPLSPWHVLLSAQLPVDLSGANG